MSAESYQRRSAEATPKPAKEIKTVSARKKPNFDSSPDVAADGSIKKSSDGHEENEKSDVRINGLLERIRGWF